MGGDAFTEKDIALAGDLGNVNLNKPTDSVEGKSDSSVDQIEIEAINSLLKRLDLRVPEDLITTEYELSVLRTRELLQDRILKIAEENPELVIGLEGLDKIIDVKAIKEILRGDIILGVKDLLQARILKIAEENPELVLELEGLDKIIDVKAIKEMLRGDIISGVKDLLQARILKIAEKNPEIILELENLDKVGLSELVVQETNEDASIQKRINNLELSRNTFNYEEFAEWYNSGKDIAKLTNEYKQNYYQNLVKAIVYPDNSEGNPRPSTDIVKYLEMLERGVDKENFKLAQQLFHKELLPANLLDRYLRFKEIERNEAAPQRTVQEIPMVRSKGKKRISPYTSEQEVETDEDSYKILVSKFKIELDDLKEDLFPGSTKIGGNEFKEFQKLFDNLSSSGEIDDDLLLRLINSIDTVNSKYKLGSQQQEALDSLTKAITIFQKKRDAIHESLINYAEV